MSLVITSYLNFVGDLNIPNIGSGDPNRDYLDKMIERHEPQFLSDLLGYELANLMIEDQDVETPPTGIYYDLLHGKEFTDSLGRLNKWEGFLSEVYNPIAYYVYYLVQQDSFSTTTSIGETRPKMENSEVYTPIEKMNRAWNTMVDINCVLHDFLTVNAEDYPEYRGVEGPRDLSWGNRKFFTKQNALGI